MLAPRVEPANSRNQLVNMGTTPLSFYTIEKFGRRKLLVCGAGLMLVCQFIIAGVGTALPGSQVANQTMIAFICIYIFGFATTWFVSLCSVVRQPIPANAGQ